MERAQDAVPSLIRFCELTLNRHRDYLGDIGDTPIWLLYPVLSLCTALQLSTIEDQTRAAGRDISGETWYFWQRLYLREAKRSNPAASASDYEVPVLAKAESPLLGSLPKDAVPGDWRWLFEELELHRHEKGLRATEKLRAMLDVQAQQKKEHSTILIPPPHRPRQRATAPSRGTPQSVSGTRLRLAKKLGLPKVLVLPVPPIVCSPPTSVPPRTASSLPVNIMSPFTPSASLKRNLSATTLPRNRSVPVSAHWLDGSDMFCKQPKISTPTMTLRANGSAIHRMESYSRFDQPASARMTPAMPSSHRSTAPSPSPRCPTLHSTAPGENSVRYAHNAAHSRVTASPLRIKCSSQTGGTLALGQESKQSPPVSRLSCTEDEFGWGVRQHVKEPTSALDVRGRSHGAAGKATVSRWAARMVAEPSSANRHRTPAIAGFAQAPVANPISTPKYNPQRDRLHPVQAEKAVKHQAEMAVSSAKGEVQPVQNKHKIASLLHRQ